MDRPPSSYPLHNISTYLRSVVIPLGINTGANPPFQPFALSNSLICYIPCHRACYPPSETSYPVRPCTLLSLSPQITDCAPGVAQTGFLCNEHGLTDRSPQSSYTTLPISYIPSSGSKSNGDPKDRPTISVRPGRTSHSPRSISAFIPTPSFQFDGSPKGPSPTSPGSRSLIHKRSRSRSSDGSSHFSGPSDKTHYDQESEGESPAVPVPPQKRRREEKKHQCPYCKKLFHRPVSLGVHINTHTGDKRTSTAFFLFVSER